MHKPIQKIGTLLILGLAVGAFSRGRKKEAVPSTMPEGERYKTTLPDTLDLADRGALALNALTGELDPNLGYEPYFPVALTTNPPVMGHDHNGLPVFAGKYSEAYPQLRIMSGSTQKSEYDRGLMQTVVSLLKSDGMFYAPARPDRPWHGKDVDYASLSGNARLMLGMMAWYQYDKDPAWKTRLDKMVQGLSRFAVHKDNYAYFPDAGVGDGYYGEYYPESGPRHTEEPKDELSGSGESSTLIWTAPALRGVARWYAISGNPEALKFATELKNFVIKPKFWGGLVELKGVNGAEHGHWRGHFHGFMEALRALIEYANATNDYALKQFVREGYEYMRQFGIPRIGWFPDWIGPQGTKVVQGDIPGRTIALAIKLSDSGVGDYWDDVDQYIRNMGVEGQVTDPTTLAKLAATGAKREVRPHWETADGVLDKTLGCYFGNLTPNEAVPDGKGVFHSWGCCTINGSLGLYYAWEGIVRSDGSTTRVNLLLNRASPWVDVDSYLPFEGKVVLKNKTSRRIFVRLPGWVDKKAVVPKVGAAKVEPLWDGNYLLFDNLKKGAVVTVEFPVAERTEKHSWLGQEYTFQFRGNTVVDVHPRGTGPIPLFVRERFKATKAPLVTKERYVSHTIIKW